MNFLYEFLYELEHFLEVLRNIRIKFTSSFRFFIQVNSEIF